MMLPLMLDVSQTPIAIIGNDYAAVMRLNLVDQSGAQKVDVYAPEPSEALKTAASERLLVRMPVAEDFSRAAYKIVYICDISDSEARLFRDIARGCGALVNVHDIKALCDFHVPARLIRGDLQVTVSTNGRAAGLARILRDHLANRVFGPDWAAKVSSLGAARDSWRDAGAPFSELVERTENFVAHRGWLTRQHETSGGGTEG
jgi:precorrin-2 dehydrogenase / sirohydrochlorin ferrochelatase